jgi:hypothetical protein
MSFFGRSKTAEAEPAPVPAPSVRSTATAEPASAVAAPSAPAVTASAAVPTVSPEPALPASESSARNRGLERVITVPPIPDLERRRDAAAKFEAHVKATDVIDELEKPVREKFDQKLDEQREDYQKQLDEARAKIRAAHLERQTAISAEFDAALKAAVPEELRQRASEAEAAYYDDESVPGVRLDYADQVERCALTGEPLLEDDEVIEDRETGELVLRAALLPPRPDRPEEPQEDEDPELDEDPDGEDGEEEDPS